MSVAEVYAAMCQSASAMDFQVRGLRILSG